MKNPNLYVRFTLAENSEVQVRDAVRIRVDGLGGLIVYDAATGKPERLSLAQLNSISIDSPSRTVAHHIS
jgi:hypothetical protein